MLLHPVRQLWSKKVARNPGRATINIDVRKKYRLHLDEIVEYYQECDSTISMTRVMEEKLIEDKYIALGLDKKPRK